METFGSWSVLTTNFLVVLYLALGGIIFATMLELAKGKWRLQIRFIAVSFAALLPIAFVLLLILLAFGENTFPWLAEMRANPDMHLQGWHNYTFLVSREIVGFLIMAGLSCTFVRYLKLADADGSPEVEERLRWVRNVIPFAHVIYGTMVAWDFEMTLVPGWHSAEYGLYQMQSMFQFFLACLVIYMFILDKSGRLAKPFEYRLYNYIGQFLLGMTIMWVYFYFVQYLIFWYGRLPHDMDRYFRMIDEGYLPLGFIFFVCKFAIPFGLLIFTPIRHSANWIVLIALFVVLGTWVERYVWISGSVESRFYHMPMSSLQDIAITGVVVVLSALTLRFALGRMKLLES